MAYTPDPTNVTQPIGSVKAGTADEEFRALKAYIKRLVLGAVSSGPAVRQTALIGIQDANGDPNFLAAGTGLALNLSALSAPLALSYAAGSVAAGDLNYNEAIGADIPDVVTGLQPSNLNYITKIFNGAWGSTLAPCQYGKVFDRTAQLMLRFPGANNAVATTEDFGNAITFIANAKISTAVQILGLNTLACDGANDGVGIPVPEFGGGSWELFGAFRTASLAALQTMLHMSTGGGIGLQIDITTAGRFTVNISSNGVGNDIMAATGATTLIAINTTYFWRITYDAVGGTYRLYVSNNGGAEVQELTATSALKICKPVTFNYGTYIGSAQSFNGNLGYMGFRKWASFTSAQATGPIVAPTFADVKTDFFSIPQMKMYEVTAASTVAGTNPAMTAINKLYLGEAITGVAAVTTAVSYAFKGEYTSGYTNTLPAAASLITVTHNLGVVPQSVVLRVRNIMSEFTVTPGQELTPFSINASYAQVPTPYSTEKVANYRTGSSSPFAMVSQNGTAVTLTAANWAYRVLVKRGW